MASWTWKVDERKCFERNTKDVARTHRTKPYRMDRTMARTMCNEWKTIFFVCVFVCMVIPRTHYAKFYFTIDSYEYQALVEWASRTIARVGKCASIVCTTIKTIGRWCKCFHICEISDGTDDSNVPLISSADCQSDGFTSVECIAPTSHYCRRTNYPTHSSTGYYKPINWIACTHKNRFQLAQPIAYGHWE